MSDKGNPNHFQLITGDFEADEAQEILLSLIDNKIGFHERKDFSLQERFGETEPSVLNRLDQLRQTKKELSELLQAAVAENQRLSIHCTIDIALKPSSR
ncbi:hypothetical protein N9W78_00395 [bacterium]|nr:hypothetical protein [bacterium]